MKKVLRKVGKKVKKKKGEKKLTKPWKKLKKKLKKTLRKCWENWGDKKLEKIEEKKLWNIARGTTDPGCKVHNFSSKISSNCCQSEPDGAT